MTDSPKFPLFSLTLHPEVSCCLQGSAAYIRVQLADYSVRRMADEGTEHSSNVATCECHHQLSWLAHGVPRVWDHIVVQELYCSLKGCKLHHCVGDLPQPERGKPLVEPGEQRKYQIWRHTLWLAVAHILWTKANEYSHTLEVMNIPLSLPPSPSTHPARPSSLYSLGAHSLRVLPQPMPVCTLTFTASMGARAMSAKNSALAEAAK